MLADRGFYGFHLFEAARKTGADLYWRVKSTVAPRFLETLSDGSWLATIKPSGNEGRKAKGTRVRVIDYTVDDGRGGPEPYLLFTTILDPRDVSASSLALCTANAGRSSRPSTN